MLFRWTILWILLISGALGCYKARAAESKVYLVGVEDISYYPYFDFRADGDHQPSFALDLLTAFFNHQQLKFKFIPLPIKRFDRWYLEHNIDFKFPDNFRWRNDQSNSMGLTFSVEILQLTAGTYVKKANADFSRKDIKSLATITGFYPTLWLQEIKRNKLEVIEDNSPLAVVRHVLAGNASGTNIDSNVIRLNLVKLNQPGEIVLAEGIYHQPYSYHMSSIKYPEVIEQFNHFLKENQQLVNELKQKYDIREPVL
ncbi:hypothetical protein [Colwellia sp. MEBiC06753]